MSKIFVPKETVPGETRVAAVPETVRKLVKRGFQITVQSGAGLGAYLSDDEFNSAGATLASDAAAAYRAADIVLKLHPPAPDEVAAMGEGTLLLSFLYPFNNTDIVSKLAHGKISAFAMDQIPRITRAQSMDALSSQANIAGYKAVLMAADHLGKLFPLLMTAAGTIQPAKVVILGAGVAGLQAIATAKRLGAVVEVSDVRAAVKEQVHSLGGKFIEVEGAEDMETSGGYAKQASEEFLKRQREIVHQHMSAADVVITTALVPGKPAPKLISEDTVKAMRNGSVIVDLAAEQGGNCVLTEKGEVVERHGVHIMGLLNIPGMLPVHASEMYAKNLLNVMNEISDKEGNVNLDFENEIIQGSIVTHGGEIRHEGVAAAMTGGQS